MPASRPPARRLWRLLLILPFIAMLAVGCYNSRAPALGSVPFFYWYQMLWVILCAVIIGVVFWIERGRPDAGEES